MIIVRNVKEGKNVNLKPVKSWQIGLKEVVRFCNKGSKKVVFPFKASVLNFF